MTVIRRNRAERKIEQARPNVVHVGDIEGSRDRAEVARMVEVEKAPASLREAGIFKLHD